MRDVAQIMTKLMKSPVVNQRFILSSENLSYQELFTNIMMAFGKKPPTIHASKWMLNLAWRVEKLKALVFKSNPIITRETVNTSQNKYYYSSDKIRQQLSFDFMPIHQSIIDTCKLFKTENSLG